MSKKAQKQQNIKRTLRGLQKFYLVGITGRTSFILENIKGIKFKITIGNELKCSCQPKLTKHCQHTLYVLSEIFYIPHDDQLIFKNKYTDVQLRYIIANRRIHNNKISDFLKYVTHRVPAKRTISQECEEGGGKGAEYLRHMGNKRVIQQQDEEDEDENICAICHMQIVKNDATTTCYTVCRNTFHLDCFSQWVKHELKNNGVVTCPLCRDQKNPQIVMELRQKECEHKQYINNKKVGLQYHYYCDGCQLKEIQATETVYKCIQCEDMTLCQTCFRLGKHIRHSFIWKQVSEKKWKECEDRKGKKKIDFQLGLIRMKLPTSRKFMNFLTCALPCYFSKNTRWNIVQCKKLDIKIQNLECIACSDKQRAFLRRMHCGHFIHHKCLRRRIEKGRLYCKIDGQKYLHGYDSLRKHQQLNKKVEEGEQIEEEEEQKQERKKVSPAKSLKLGKSASFNFKDHFQNNRSLNQDGNRSLMSRSRCNPQ